MLEQLPEFFKDRRCAKCGETGADSVYQRSNLDTGKAETITRRCRECGFIWTEAPLNLTGGDLIVQRVGGR